MQKRNHLKQKTVKYKSHKAFFSQCIGIRSIFKGIKLELNATTGNQNQSFLDNRYTKSKDQTFVTTQLKRLEL